uniref:Solute-binding protein family 3/N-terminal domain-containing protein n=1 Tax=Romanomermis culicivorax TaxID=13658 RepID=A0A915JHF7_ROMCU
AVVNEVSITDARKAKYDFSTPYITSRAVLIVRADNTTIHSDASGVLLRKGSPALVAAIDKALADIKADGTYAKFSQKYFGRDVSQP